MVTNRTTLKKEVKTAGETYNNCKVATLDILYDFGVYGKFNKSYDLELEGNILSYELSDDTFYYDETDELYEIEENINTFPSEAFKTFLKAENNEPIKWGYTMGYKLPVTSWFEVDEEKEEYEDVEGVIYFTLND